MADKLPDFENRDQSGSSVMINGTIGTTAILIPAVAGAAIDEFSVTCPTSSGSGSTVLVSFDNITFKQVTQGSNWTWKPKGFRKQFYIKGNKAGVTYEIVVNYEAE